MKVTHSDWAAPIVAVPKQDGKLRICGDYKVTVNAALDIDQYPLPKPDDLFASLAGGKKFTKLDLAQAYQQLVLDENSRKYTTINTHQGCTNIPGCHLVLHRLQLFSRKQWTRSFREFLMLHVTLTTS